MKAILLLALVICATATADFKKFAPMNIKKERNLLAVLTQVEATLKSGGALEIINKTLNQFEQEITEEQAAHDGLIERSRVQCAEEFDFRRREVADASAALREGTATLEGAQDQLRRASSDLKFVQNSLIEYNEYLEVLADRREREASDFAGEQAAYELNAATAAEAIELLESVFGGEEEFIQLAKHSHKLFKAAMSSGKPETFANTFAALASLSTNQNDADLELLERVRNVLQNLSEAIESNWNDRVALEEQLIAASEEAVANATQVVNDLLQEQSNLTVEVADLKKVIVTETGVVAAATAKRNRNQNLWDDAEDLCELQDAEYENGTNGRRQERDLIDAIRSKVETRYGLPQ